MEISHLLTSAYYDAEKVLQNKIDIGRSADAERTERGVEGRDEFISQHIYDKLSGLRFQMGGYEMQRITDRLSASADEAMSTIESLSPSLEIKIGDIQSMKMMNLWLSKVRMNCLSLSKKLLNFH